MSVANASAAGQRESLKEAEGLQEPPVNTQLVVRSERLTSTEFLNLLRSVDEPHSSLIRLAPLRSLRFSSTDSPISGMSVLLKDNIETRDMPTTAGSLALADNAPGRDAPLVTRLRDAGALILGKTNLSEWANIRSSESISGWSAVGGQTRNPYDGERTPCGSSSGRRATGCATGAAPGS